MSSGEMAWARTSLARWLAEQPHQQRSVPLRQRLPGAVRCLAAVGREQVQERRPLDEIPSRNLGTRGRRRYPDSREFHHGLLDLRVA
jgi:hypothetical protein